MHEINKTIATIREHITAICKRIGRDAGSVEIIAVTKTKPATCITTAVEAGIGTIGENRVQETELKRKVAGQNASWHLIGHLQSNKVKKAVQLFDCIQSVDSIHLAEKLDRECKKAGKVLPILLQVNTSGEESKFGISPDGALQLAKLISGGCSSLSVNGLMTIGAYSQDKEEVRKGFKQLRLIAEQIAQAQLSNITMKHLSMGMSGDYEIAIEEGATMIRLGSILFGSRRP